MSDLERLVGKLNTLRIFLKLLSYPSYADYAEWWYWLDYIRANRN